MDQQQPQTPASADAVPQVDAAAPPTPNVKQQVVEKINGAKNVLVTVGANPTVDELAATLGLTFLLGKLNKHATAVFSGETPAAIDFLDPDKTFERTVDSLRDFIIALDKEKADKLRYKVEDDVVKVFITPYRTVISEKDLEFSQGDFNVDVIVAFGITRREDLDKAITAHGRILHDAEVITINANGKTSNLGSIDWSDEAASSVSEMLVSISESFGSGLLDEQIATALLTGIVAETNRFSNEKTSPKVMTMSAQLMAAGANQQLIASNLRQEGMITESIRTKSANAPQEDNAEVVLDHGDTDDTSSAKSSSSDTTKKSEQASQKPKVQPTDKPKNQSDSKPEQKPADTKPKPPDMPPAPVDTPKLPEVQPVEEPVEPDLPPVPKSTPTPVPAVDLPPLPSAQPPQPAESSVLPGPASPPEFGGALSATADQAQRDQALQDAKDRQDAPLESSEVIDETASNDDALAAARAELENLTNEQPFDPANNPTESIGAQELPPVHAPDAMTPDGSAGTMQETTSTQNAAVATIAEEPSPVDAFMQPHQDTPQAPNPLNTPTVPQAPAPQAAGGTDLPPLPPLPPVPNNATPGGMPPMPPMPGQATDPTAGFQPQTNPDFMKDVSQSQNAWTEAGQEMADKNAKKEADRQAKLDQMGEQYDAAVDKNLELQGKPPINNDHSTFPLPPTK